MLAAIADDRDALAFGLQRLRAETLGAASSLREDEVTGGEQAAVWNQRFAALYYLNVPRLVLDPAARLDYRGSEALANLTSFRTADPTQMMGALGLFDKVIESWEQTTVEVKDLARVGDVPVGGRLSFISWCHTKNLAGRDVREINGLSGDLAQDPHVWAQARAYLPLDTRWITTATATHEFTSGRVRLAGIGILRATSAERVMISPLALGMPLTKENAWFYDPERRRPPRS